MISVDQLIFYAILIGGGVALLFVNWPRRAGGKRGGVGRASVEGHNLVEELLFGPAAGGEEAREWLDRLLVQQQSEQPEK